MLLQWIMKRMLIQLVKLRSVAGCIMLLGLITLFWRMWEKQLLYYPFEWQIRQFSSWIVARLYLQCSWLLEHGFHAKAWFDGITLWLDKAGSLTINNPCSGMQQFGQFVLLVVFYPGPWHHKTWYIPLGILVMHGANIMRITGLSLVIIHLPRHWDFFHDFAAKGFFYLVIFSLWMLWESRIYSKSRGTGQPVPGTDQELL
jgi:exosortase/archaeosortase family protein